MVCDEIHRLPDLSFARLTVADDAVDRLGQALTRAAAASPAATDKP